MSNIDYIKLDIETQSLSKSMSFMVEKKTLKKIEKVGNCIIINLPFKNIKLVIGPHYYLFPFAQLLFISFDIFILKNLHKKLSSFIITINIIIVSYLVIIYTINLFLDPGIIYYKKKNLDSHSEITCDICLTSKSDKSIHCKECGICVVERSHHCVWIGKCVGKNNEIAFYGFVAGGGLYYFVIFLITAIVHYVFF